MSPYPGFRREGMKTYLDMLSGRAGRLFFNSPGGTTAFLPTLKVTQPLHSTPECMGQRLKQSFRTLDTVFEAENDILNFSHGNRGLSSDPRLRQGGGGGGGLPGRQRETA